MISYYSDDSKIFSSTLVNRKHTYDLGYQVIIQYRWHTQNRHDHFRRMYYSIPGGHEGNLTYIAHIIFFNGSQKGHTGVSFGEKKV